MHFLNDEVAVAGAHRASPARSILRFELGEVREEQPHFRFFGSETLRFNQPPRIPGIRPLNPTTVVRVLNDRDDEAFLGVDVQSA